MTKRERELWARAVVEALSGVIPTWPKDYTRKTWEAKNFYMAWLSDLGYRIWDF